MVERSEAFNNSPDTPVSGTQPAGYASQSPASSNNYSPHRGGFGPSSVSYLTIPEVFLRFCRREAPPQYGLSVAHLRVQAAGGGAARRCCVNARDIAAVAGGMTVRLVRCRCQRLEIRSRETQRQNDRLGVLCVVVDAVSALKAKTKILNIHYITPWQPAGDGIIQVSDLFTERDRRSPATMMGRRSRGFSDGMATGRVGVAGPASTRDQSECHGGRRRGPSTVTE